MSKTRVYMKDAVAVIVIIILFPPILFAASINVPGDQPTIQAGIDVAISGVDEVVVAPGTYNEILDLKGKAITVRSSGGAAVTTIDAGPVADPGTGKPVIRCDSGEDPGTIINGFTITGGTGDTSTFGSASSHGGGMFVFNSSSPVVKNCVFFANTAVNSGGGISIPNGSINTSIVTVTNCAFIGNTTDGSGGGMDLSGDNGTVTNCAFSGNVAGEVGGGINNGSGRPTITNCTFTANHADDNGGGIFTRSSNPSGGSPKIRNSILWNNSDAGGVSASAQIHVQSGTPSVNHSDVQGGWTGTGANNIDADPLFMDADGADNVVGTDDDDLHLSAGSPCINTGDNSVVTEATDLDGNARIANVGCGFPETVDMGAYEFHPSPGDQDGDGAPDASDNCPCYPNPTQEYNRADFDEDCDVDGVDFAVFASCFNKAGNPPRTLGCPHP